MLLAASPVAQPDPQAGGEIPMMSRRRTGIDADHEVSKEVGMRHCPNDN